MPDGAEEEAVTRISWCFAEEDKVDVVQHCLLGLQKLDSILKQLRPMNHTAAGEQGLIGSVRSDRPL
jgi:hypothetical protein